MLKRTSPLLAALAALTMMATGRAADLTAGMQQGNAEARNRSARSRSLRKASCWSATRRLRRSMPSPRATSRPAAPSAAEHRENRREDRRRVGHHAQGHPDQRHGREPRDRQHVSSRCRAAPGRTLRRWSCGSIRPGKLGEFPLDDVKFSQAEIPNAPGRGPQAAGGHHRPAVRRRADHRGRPVERRVRLATSRARLPVQGSGRRHGRRDLPRCARQAGNPLAGPHASPCSTSAASRTCWPLTPARRW